jgi:hypothetical protein
MGYRNKFMEMDRNHFKRINRWIKCKDRTQKKYFNPIEDDLITNL